jgi:long-chain acyl-CoA synthetase
MLQEKDYIADWPDFNYQNFIEWLDSIASKWRDKTAIFYRGDGNSDFTRWSFGHFANECRRIARGLLAMGLKKGDRVVLWAENRPEWMAVWMGTAISGCVIVPVDFLVSEQECKNIIEITKAKAFFFSERKSSFAKSLVQGENELLAKICISPRGTVPGELTYADFGEGSASQPIPAASGIAPSDPVSIVFTSGTTGFAKGVVLHHHGIIINASSAVLSLRADSKDTFINVLPLHHTYPTTCSFIAPLTVGAGTIIVERIVGQVVINDIHDAGGNFLIAVPLLYEKFMAAIDDGLKKQSGLIKAVLGVLRKIALDEAKKGRVGFGQKYLKFIRKKAKLDSIRICVAGGAPLNPATADFFDSLGFNMVHGYGMSENSPLISVSTPFHRRNESVGLPVKYTKVQILDENEEESRAAGRKIGEIAIKSPSVMLGYYENQEATDEIFTEIDGEKWLRTGDLGFIDDDGFVFINGRKKNLLVSSGGKNIYPEEIEGHFGASRIVGEILVVGRRDAGGGEMIFAVIYPNMEALAADHPGKTLDADFMKPLVKTEIENVNRTLPGYKKISDFTLIDKPFEKNAQQKIRRFLYKNFEG